MGGNSHISHSTSPYNQAQSTHHAKTTKTLMDSRNKIIKVDLTVNLSGEDNLGPQSTEVMRTWMK